MSPDECYYKKSTNKRGLMTFLKENYHNSHKEISLYELNRDLSIIESKIDFIEFIQESILLSFVLPDFMRITIEKHRKELRQEWICLAFFIEESSKTPLKQEELINISA